jgi:hypothetical protein
MLAHHEEESQGQLRSEATHQAILFASCFTAECYQFFFNNGW